MAAQTERAAAGEARAAELEKRANEVHDDLKAERARRDEAEAARRTVEAELSTPARGRGPTLPSKRQTWSASWPKFAVNLRECRIKERPSWRRRGKSTPKGRLLNVPQHDAEVGRLKDAHQQALHDQKQRSVEVIGKLETSKQRMEAELDEARKEARDAAAQLGRVTGELDALRSQVASQEATIRGFTAKKADKT